jgi:toxin ParE1/3/4
MPSVNRRESVRRDLAQHFVRIAEEAGLDTADRFLASADQTFDDLARMPMMGALVATPNTELSGLRKWRIRDFENFLICYFPHAHSVDIIRVICASRDWIGILDEQVVSH